MGNFAEIFSAPPPHVVVQVCAPPSVHDESATGYHVGLPTYNLIENGAHGDI